MMEDDLILDISIHALLAESDPRLMFFWLCGLLFLSTLSLRRATVYPGTWSGSILISIHALLAESDNLRVVDGSKSSIISIHALLAESDFTMTITICTVSRFLSTLSLRRATARRASRQQPAGISIHALLAESDPEPPRVVREPATNFYPRSPCGERLLGRGVVV